MFAFSCSILALSRPMALYLCSSTGQTGGGGQVFKLGTVKSEWMVNVAVGD